MYAEEFAQHAARYKAELLKSTSFNEHHALWQQTSIPYAMRETDAYSAAYGAEVQGIYAALTEMAYGVDNEMTSTKIDDAAFQRGYPWITNRLDVVSSEMIKVCQAMQALHRQGGEASLDIVEFGCGWGNLAVPLAKAGQKMTAVDIDAGFLTRLAGIFAREGLPLQTVQGDFTEAARRLPQRYDAAIFQASFHHCLAFQELLELIEGEVLNDHGQVYFFSEPVFPGYPFPWGLRYDGESLWAIMINKWLELGFDQDFFANLLLRKGFFIERIDEIPGHLGPGWRGLRNAHALPFSRWFLPAAQQATFHPDTGDGGRFMRAESHLPGLAGARRQTYVLRVRNHGAEAIIGRAESGGELTDITVPAGEERLWTIPAGNGEVMLRSTTFVPHAVYHNGDDREVGLFVASVACS